MLQEQLHEREQSIHELERKMEEKDRELHAVRLDNEAVSFVKKKMVSSLFAILLRALFADLSLCRLGLRKIS